MIDKDSEGKNLALKEEWENIQRLEESPRERLSPGSRLSTRETPGIHTLHSGESIRSKGNAKTICFDFDECSIDVPQRLSIKMTQATPLMAEQLYQMDFSSSESDHGEVKIKEGLLQTSSNRVSLRDNETQIQDKEKPANELSMNFWQQEFSDDDDSQEKLVPKSHRIGPPNPTEKSVIDILVTDESGPDTLDNKTTATQNRVAIPKFIPGRLLSHKKGQVVKAENCSPCNQGKHKAPSQHFLKSEEIGYTIPRKSLNDRFSSPSSTNNKTRSNSGKSLTQSSLKLSEKTKQSPSNNPETGKSVARNSLRAQSLKLATADEMSEVKEAKGRHALTGTPSANVNGHSHQTGKERRFEIQPLPTKVTASSQNTGKAQAQSNFELFNSRKHGTRKNSMGNLQNNKGRIDIDKKRNTFGVIDTGELYLPQDDYPIDNQLKQKNSDSPRKQEVAFTSMPITISPNNTRKKEKLQTAPILLKKGCFDSNSTKPIPEGKGTPREVQRDPLPSPRQSSLRETLPAVAIEDSFLNAEQMALQENHEINENDKLQTKLNDTKQAGKDGPMQKLSVQQIKSMRKIENEVHNAIIRSYLQSF